MTGARWEDDPELARAMQEREAGVQRLVDAGAVVREAFGSRVQSRWGDCYRLVLRAAGAGKLPVGSFIVFGRWHPAGLPHVWVELPDGRVWEPVSATLGPGDAQRERWDLAEHAFTPSRYTTYDALRALSHHRIFADLAILDRASRNQTPDAD